MEISKRNQVLETLLEKDFRFVKISFILKNSSLKTSNNTYKSIGLEDNSLHLSSSIKNENNIENNVIKKSKKVQDLIVNNENNIIVKLIIQKKLKGIQI